MGSDFRTFGYFLRTFHLLIEIYPMVPFPSSVRVGFLGYTRTLVRCTPVTRAGASACGQPWDSRTQHLESQADLYEQHVDMLI